MRSAWRTGNWSAKLGDKKRSDCDGTGIDHGEPLQSRFRAKRSTKSKKKCLGAIAYLIYAIWLADAEGVVLSGECGKGYQRSEIEIS